MTGRIVVGVDGSEGSRRALAWALEEAAHRSATLEVVHAWSYPTGGELAGLPWKLNREDFEKTARLTLEQAVAEAGPREPGVHVELLLLEGPAVRTLLQQAREADLLVVGSRGRGGFGGLLLGSVSQQCAYHAPCPIVIVPPLDGKEGR